MYYFIYKLYDIFTTQKRSVGSGATCVQQGLLFSVVDVVLPYTAVFSVILDINAYTVIIEHD